MDESKKKFRINFFDIVIIAIVACIGIGLYVFTHRDTALETKQITYKIELNGVVKGLADYIHEGDVLYENTKNYKMGSVVSVETVPYSTIIPDYENNEYKDSVDPTCESVIITLNADVTETDSAYAVDGQFIVRAGTDIFVKGPGYAGEGYVIEIER